MPRPWEVEVEPFLEYVPRRYYKVRVTEVDKNRKPRGVLVTLTHIENDQQGRKTQLVLWLPPRPEGLTANFFRACGMAIYVGSRFKPEDCAGKTISASFAQDPDDKWHVVDFAPVTQEKEESV